MDNPSLQLDCSYNRNFGVEIELNSFDGRDFKERPLRTAEGELPKGIDYIAELIAENSFDEVSIARWHYTHNNTHWVVKPDSSCGMEVCSPVLTGREGVEEICRIINVLKEDKKAQSDDRCSLHFHVDLSDLGYLARTSVLAYWIKCEAVFLDSVPFHRKLNRYCQMIGISDMFEHNTDIDYEHIVKTLGKHKYHTLNTYHLFKNRRETVEFRIAEAAACQDVELASNWMRLILHFVNCAKSQPVPPPYECNNPWTSFLWLDPIDVFDFLGFDGSYSLSEDLEETRNWFLRRLHTNVRDVGVEGIWSDVVRSRARDEIEMLAERFGVK